MQANGYFSLPDFYTGVNADPTIVSVPKYYSVEYTLHCIPEQYGRSLQEEADTTW